MEDAPSRAGIPYRWSKPGRSDQRERPEKKRPRRDLLALVAMAGLVALSLGVSAAAQSAPARNFTVPVEQGAFTLSQIECADYFSPTVYPRVLRLVGVEGGLQQSQYTTGEIVYLNQASSYHPGDQVRLMRVGRVSAGHYPGQFSGQAKLLSHLGTYFETVGRANILRLDQDGTALARISFSCQPAELGDFAIAWHARPVPPRASQHGINLIQPVSPSGSLIAAGRDGVEAMGTGAEVYLAAGRGQGARLGQRWLIVRSRNSPSSRQLRPSGRSLYAVAFHEPGLNVGRLASQPQPPRIVGELTLIQVEARASTGVITYARDQILAGDRAVPER